MESEQPKGQLRTIFKTAEFDRFYSTLPPRVQEKFKYVMSVIISVYDVPTKFIKHLQNSDLYEMRVSVGTNEYRTVLFAIDHSNVIESTKIILLNGFLKKSSKDYKKQIELATKILENISK